ncbi:MAG: carbonate dehydratase [Planctomycetes bacterium]|nr:carbonate dehydratase [Planctomycetota bacterium]MBL7037340.1 carbonate dehydratase [Pirellulaceae bacterium]
MRQLRHLFDNNRAWVEQMLAKDATFFERLAEGQFPEILWIGCSDSRVPANQIVGLLPGELFVHRNVANLFVHTDLNCLSVLQYAVDVLQVKHVIVCGHYRCGGLLAVLRNDRMGLIDHWLQHAVDVREKHRDLLESVADADLKANIFCELNVIEQVDNLCTTNIVKDAWSRGQQTALHGWIYDIKDGLLRDLDVCLTGEDDIAARCEAAVARIAESAAAVTPAE